MTDIVERSVLARVSSCDCHTKTPEVPAHDIKCRYRVLSEMADEIERLREALKPFAGFHVGVSANDDAAAAYGVFHGNNEPLKVGDFRRARNVLSEIAAPADTTDADSEQKSGQ